MKNNYIDFFIKIVVNLNGSAKDDLVSGGGVIRNEEESLVAAYSSFYGNGTNNLAKFLALQGLLLCIS